MTEEQCKKYDYDVSRALGRENSRFAKKGPDYTKILIEDIEPDQMASAMNEEQRARVIETTDADKVPDILTAEQRIRVVETTAADQLAKNINQEQRAKVFETMTDEEFNEIAHRRQTQDKPSTDKAN